MPRKDWIKIDGKWRRRETVAGITASGRMISRSPKKHPKRSLAQWEKRVRSGSVNLRDVPEPVRSKLVYKLHRGY